MHNGAPRGPGSWEQNEADVRNGYLLSALIFNLSRITFSSYLVHLKVKWVILCVTKQNEEIIAMFPLEELRGQGLLKLNFFLARTILLMFLQAS